MALSAVHPRACGERSGKVSSPPYHTGSSPRVRGTAASAQVGDLHLRFIPARAGNGRSAHGALRRRTVHPRACGERRFLPPHRRVPTGSSPRVRGTVLHPGSLPPIPRFIPARAGNGRSVATISPLPCGSSPRVRGTERIVIDDYGMPRFIPARAGNGALWD